MYITFQEFRDFLIMLPRKATPFEIYKCTCKSVLDLEANGCSVYQVRKRFSDGRGAARVDKEGDMIPSFPKTHGDSSTGGKTRKEDDEFGDESNGHAPQEDRHEAWRFLLAGGEAGAGKSSRMSSRLHAVSRTVTAPFDRLKVYLITTENNTLFPAYQSATPSSIPVRLSRRYEPVGGSDHDISGWRGTEGILGWERTECDQDLPGESSSMSQSLVSRPNTVFCLLAIAVIAVHLN